MFMRGGTSKAAMFLAADLPADPEERDLIPVDPRNYDSVIVLAGDEVDGHVDAKALTTLLLLQAIKDERGGEFSVICELEEEASRRLAWGIRADDLVLGQQVVSTLAVHYAKNPGRLEMITVVEEWLDARDTDLYFEPAGDYVQLDVPVSWVTVVAAAARRRQTAIGYVVHDQRFDEKRGYGVYLNPAKSSVTAYRERDQIGVSQLRHTRLLWPFDRHFYWSFTLLLLRPPTTRAK